MPCIRDEANVFLTLKNECDYLIEPNLRTFLILTRCVFNANSFKIL